MRCRPSPNAKRLIGLKCIVKTLGTDRTPLTEFTGKLVGFSLSLAPIVGEENVREALALGFIFVNEL